MPRSLDGLPVLPGSPREQVVADTGAATAVPWASWTSSTGKASCKRRAWRAKGTPCRIRRGSSPRRGEAHSSPAAASWGRETRPRVSRPASANAPGHAAALVVIGVEHGISDVEVFRPGALEFLAEGLIASSGGTGRRSLPSICRVGAVDAPVGTASSSGVEPRAPPVRCRSG